METLAKISWLIPLLPLVAAAVAGFAGKRILGGRSHWPIWIGVGGSAVLSLALLFTMLAASPNQSLAFTDDYETVVANKPEIIGKKDKADEAHSDEVHSDDESHAGDDAHAHDDHAHHGPDGDVKIFRSHWFTWIAAGDDNSQNVPPSLTEAQVVELALSRGEAGVLPDQLPDVTQVGTDGRTSGYFEVVAGALLDPLSVVMLSVVCGIGFLITIFAAGYMKGETGYWRFFAYLGLFLFSMTCLVMGENLIMLYLGWEGVGLCSYLLIGYYFDKPAAREAAKKA
ncbi:MAG: proton-conducting transporter membrane subunit, partial [Planctomycetota bacterium]